MKYNIIEMEFQASEAVHYFIATAICFVWPKGNQIK